MSLIFQRIAIAALTFAVGISSTMLINILRPQVSKQPTPHRQEFESVHHTQPQAPATVVPSNGSSKKDRLESLSPYAIEMFIDAQPQADVQDIWRRLGVRPKLTLDHHPGGEEFFSTCSGCEAETYEYDLDGHPGSEVLLRVSDRLQEACRYLIFKHNGATSPEEKWQLLGHIDHDFGRYMMPRHHLVVGGGKTWLVVQVQAASGTGVSLYIDRVFEISRDKLREVINYTSEGHQAGFDFEPSREFSGRISDIRNEKGDEVIEVLFSVTYSLTESSEWQKKQKAVFVRRANKFMLDARRSELSWKEMDAVYNIDSLSNEDLLKYNYQHLLKIANGRDQESKEMLGHFLRNCETTSEKKSLLRLL